MTVLGWKDSGFVRAASQAGAAASLVTMYSPIGERVAEQPLAQP
jgi:hypothetical protein